MKSEHASTVTALQTTLKFAAVFMLGACASQVAGTSPKATAHEGAHALVRSVAELPAKMVGSGKAWVHTVVQQDAVFIGRLHLAAEAKVPLHADPDLEVIYVLEGSGQLNMDGVDYAVSPGTAIVMPAGAKVSYTNGKLPFVGLQVFAPGASASKYDAWAPKS